MNYILIRSDFCLTITSTVVVTEYGLGAAIFTKNFSQAQKIARKIRAGTVWVNCYDVFDAALPFGGFKQSGIGRELGEAGLLPYLENKTVVYNLD